MTKWLLIIVTTTLGGLFSSNESTQQKLGPYMSQDECELAADSVPKEIRRRNGLINATLAHITAYCLPITDNDGKE